MKIGTDTTSDVEKRCIEMDTLVLYYKKESSTYEDFLNKVKEKMIVSNEETFRRCYWDRDFEGKLLKDIARKSGEEDAEEVNEFINQPY